MFRFRFSFVGVVSLLYLYSDSQPTYCSLVNMASPRPKSPRPATPQKKKDESFLEYLGTLGRRKKIKEGMNFLKIKLKVLICLLKFWNSFIIFCYHIWNYLQFLTSVMIFSCLWLIIDVFDQMYSLCIIFNFNINGNKFLNWYFSLNICKTSVKFRLR